MAHLVRFVGAFVTRRPWPVLVTVVVVTGLFGVLAGQRQSVSADEGASGSAARAQQTIEQRFGSSVVPLQVLVTTPGEDVRNVDTLRTIRDIRRALQASPVAEQLAGTGATPAVGSFLAPADQALPDDLGGVDDQQVREAQRLALEAAPPQAARQVEGLLGSTEVGPPEDGLVLVRLDVEGLDDEQALAAQRQAAAAIESVSPPAAVQVEPFSFALLLDGDIGGEIGRLFGIAFLVILLVLAALYWVRPADGERLRTARRTAADVGLTLIAVIAAVVWMQGLGVLLGPQYLGLIPGFFPQAQVVPILIVALGVDYAIHFTDRYREDLGEGAEPAEGLQRASSTVGVALVLASLTTAIGFLTNVVSPFDGLVTLGVLAAVGILAALVITLTLLPAARLVLDRRADDHRSLPRESLAHREGNALSRATGSTSTLATRWPLVAIAAALVLATLGGWGFTRLDTEFSLTDFVPQDSPQLETYQTIQEDFAGGFGQGTDVLLTGAVASPSAHNALVDAVDDVGSLDAVTTVDGQPAATSPLSVLRAGIAEDDAVARAAEAAGVADDLRVDPSADVGRLYSTLLERLPERAGAVLAQEGDSFSAVVSLRTSSPDDASAFADRLEEVFAPATEQGVTVTPTSNPILTSQVNEQIRRSQLVSMAAAVIAAGLLLGIYYWVAQRRPVLGLLTVVQVTLVIAWTFGAMNLLGIPLTPITATLAALSIGIGIDFAIHIVNRFVEARRDEDELEDALRATTESTGAALTGSAVTTLAGFGVLVTASLVPFRQLGAVTMLAVGFSLLAALLVLPSMLVLAERMRGDA
jgi:uncharacterized protein